MSRRSLTMLFSFLAIIGFGSTSWSAPTISNVSLRGLQIGAKTRIVVSGNDLAPNPRLMLTIPILTQKVMAGATAQRVEFEVIVDNRSAAGLGAIRVATTKGVSNPIVVGLDRLPQQPHGPKTERIPVALSGNLAGAQILKTEFPAKKGQRLVAEVECQRLGGKVQPILRLLSPAGKQLAWSPALVELGGDARLRAELPADGTYTLVLHDMLYRAAAPGHFRLKIGELQYGNLAHPIGVPRGKKTEVSVMGGELPENAKAVIDAEAANVSGQRAAALPIDARVIGSSPRVIVSDYPEIVEADAKTPQPLPSIPVGANGVIRKAGEEDRYLLDVKPGSKLRFDVFARQVGSPLDGLLILRNENGNELARNDDRPGLSDPRLDFTVPANIKKLIVSVRDLHKRGGPRFVYRVAIEDLAKPDFRLTLDKDRINIPTGGTQTVRVDVERRGYNGRIQLRATGLPEHVRVAGDQIVAGSRIGLLTLSSSKAEPFLGGLKVEGRSEGDQPVVRAARTKETPVNKSQPWLRETMAVALLPPGPIRVNWASGKEDKLYRGAKYAGKVDIDRNEGVTGKVRLRMVTTQAPPTKNIKKNNKPQTVADVERTLRLEGSPIIDGAAKHGVAPIITPLDLPDRPWGVVVVAELLAADNKTVVATDSTATRFFTVANPMTLKLSGEAKITAKAGKGDTGSLSGVVHRGPGFDKPLTITVEGLPKGYAAPKLMLAADKSEFVLPVRFPYGAKAGELKGANLVVIYQPDPKNNKRVLRSNTAPVTIVVEPGEKPAEAKKKPAKKP